MSKGSLSRIRRQMSKTLEKLRGIKLRIELSAKDLPSIQRQVLRLRHIEGRHWHIVADETGYSVRQLINIRNLAIQTLFRKHRTRLKKLKKISAVIDNGPSGM